MSTQSLLTSCQTQVMIVLKFPCCLAHCWHHILLLFHFGRMCRSRNQNCYFRCYCNQKIFHFGRMLLSWKYHCCHWSPHAEIGFLCTVAVSQVCLHHSETCRHWNLYQSLSQRVFLFGRMCWSCELQAWNWPNGTVGRVSSDWWLSLGLITDRSPPRS